MTVVAPTGISEPPVLASPAVSMTSRVYSVDLLRGLAMVLMALDHTRDYFTYLRFPPELLSQTFGALFLTRWVTHICAPSFFFLAGTGAYLSATRGKSLNQISHFLWTRGLWLVFLELTVIWFAWTFVPHIGGAAIVIWALGWSMVLMAAIVRLPFPVIAVLGLGMIATHNLLDRINPASFGGYSWIWLILHVPGFYLIKPPATGFFVLYPLIPWVGVMAAGYCCGRLVQKPAAERRRVIFRLGFALTVTFLILRGLNLYGNGVAGLGFGIPFSAGPWQVQPSFTLTLISFFNTQKYPPSLQFLLMTLGPALMLLAGFESLNPAGRLGRILLVFGRVPMFFYVLHIYLIHLMAVGVGLLFHQPISWLLHGGFFLSEPQPGYGHHLPFIYLMWLLAVAILYFPCRWFMRLKERRRDWWLSYL